MRVYSCTDSGLTVTLSFLCERPANLITVGENFEHDPVKKLSISETLLLALPRGHGHVYAFGDLLDRSSSCQLHQGRELRRKNGKLAQRRWLDVATLRETESRMRKSSFRGGSSYRQRLRRFREWKR